MGERGVRVSLLGCVCYRIVYYSVMCYSVVLQSCVLKDCVVEGVLTGYVDRNVYTTPRLLSLLSSSPLFLSLSSSPLFLSFSSFSSQKSHRLESTQGREEPRMRRGRYGPTDEVQEGEAGGSARISHRARAGTRARARASRRGGGVGGSRQHVP